MPREVDVEESSFGAGCEIFRREVRASCLVRLARSIERRFACGSVGFYGGGVSWWRDKMGEPEIEG